MRSFKTRIAKTLMKAMPLNTPELWLYRHGRALKLSPLCGEDCLTKCRSPHCKVALSRVAPKIRDVLCQPPVLSGKAHGKLEVYPFWPLSTICHDSQGPTVHKAAVWAWLPSLDGTKNERPKLPKVSKSVVQCWWKLGETADIGIHW